MNTPAVECHNCGLPDYPAVIEVGKPYVCAHCRRFAAAAARRERVRKAVERAMPSGGWLQETIDNITDAALAAMDSDGGVE
jgi:hypothetical protein